MNSTVRSQLLNFITYSKDDLENITEYIIVYAYQFIKTQSDEEKWKWSSVGKHGTCLESL